MNQFSHALVTGTGAFWVLASAVAVTSVTSSIPVGSAPVAATAISEASRPAASTAAASKPVARTAAPAASVLQEALSHNTAEAKFDPRNNHIYQQLRSKSLPHQANHSATPKPKTAPVKEPPRHTANMPPAAHLTSSIHTSANVPGAPVSLIPVYQAAGARYGIPWTVLAAIHKTETGFRTSNCPESSAGAKGPMQFLPATFAEYAVKAPGQSGPPNIQNVDDAIYTAAHMLSSDGFSRSPSRAIFAYNHSNQYVKQVETTAGL